jgi:hypothetical protein
MDPSLSREAASRSASKGFPNILFYQKALYLVHKSPPLNPVCTTAVYISKAHFNVIFPPKSRSRSRDRSVGIATVYGLDRRGSIPGKGKCFFIISYTALRPPLGTTQPSLQWVLGELTAERRRGVKLTTPM